jgi:hypothetical protein
MIFRPGNFFSALLLDTLARGLYVSEIVTVSTTRFRFPISPRMQLHECFERLKTVLGSDFLL